MKMMNIASGSSGNCTFIGTDDGSLLIDAGISMKRIEEGLNTASMTLRDIDAIFITHEHTDHIKGLKAVSRKYEIPIYLTGGTYNAMKYISNVRDIDDELFSVIGSDSEVAIRDMVVRSKSISHDAAEPVCYSVTDGKKKVSVATDLGMYDASTVEFLYDSDMMLLEANHDVRMLETGPYPYHLKKRILGSKGHLSNESCGKMLLELLHPHVKKVMLGHLSRENNFPELAFESVKNEVLESPFIDDVRDIGLSVAKRDMCSGIFEC